MDQKKIGKYIAQKRKSLNMTQVQLAEQLGMSNKSVSKWERGICLPDVSVYEPLCKVLGISLNEFLTGEDISNDQLIPKSEELLIGISKSAKNTKKKLKACILIICILVFAVIAITFEFTPGAGFKPGKEAQKLYEMNNKEGGAYSYIMDQINKEYTLLNTEKIAQTVIITINTDRNPSENHMYFSALLIATMNPQIETVIWQVTEENINSAYQYDVASFRYAFGKTWRTEDIRKYGRSAKGLQELIERFKQTP